MDNNSRKKPLVRYVLVGIVALILVFVGVPTFAAIEVENPAATFVLLLLIVGSYSTLYSR